jgi:hypothetical protein
VRRDIANAMYPVLRAELQGRVATLLLHDYAAALRFALRADRLAGGRNPAAVGYLAEAFALDKHFPSAARAAKRALAITPQPKPGEPASQLRKLLQGEPAEYEAKPASHSQAPRGS